MQDRLATEKVLAKHWCDRRVQEAGGGMAFQAVGFAPWTALGQEPRDVAAVAACTRPIQATSHGGRCWGEREHRSAEHEHEEDAGPRQCHAADG